MLTIYLLTRGNKLDILMTGREPRPVINLEWEKAMPKVNGHKNWNHWNVSLWINNHERFYREAQNCVKLAKGYTADGALRVYGVSKSGLDLAAYLLMQALPDSTPDGAPYSFSSIRAAIREI